MTTTVCNQTRVTSTHDIDGHVTLDNLAAVISLYDDISL